MLWDKEDNQGLVEGNDSLVRGIRLSIICSLAAGIIYILILRYGTMFLYV